jgi:hypothetical protein
MDKRHVDDLSCQEAGAFLCAPPVTVLGNVMESEHFRRAVALRLVGACAYPESVAPGSKCPKNCGHDDADESGRHAVGCGDAFGQRHNAVREVLRRAAVGAGVPAVETERNLWQIAERAGRLAAAAGAAILYAMETGIQAVQARPADLLWRWPSAAGVASLTAFDLTVHSPYSAAALRVPSSAAAAMQGEEIKLKAAPALKAVGAECYPLGMSTNGRMTPRMLAFVKEMAGRMARVRGVSPGEERVWLLQRISVALQRANGMALAVMGATREREERARRQ